MSLSATKRFKNLVSRLKQCMILGAVSSAHPIAQFSQYYLRCAENTSLIAYSQPLPFDYKLYTIGLCSDVEFNVSSQSFENVQE